MNRVEAVFECRVNWTRVILPSNGLVEENGSIFCAIYAPEINATKSYHVELPKSVQLLKEVFPVYVKNLLPLADICNTKLTSPSGTIITPNYPSPYPSSITCKWVITVKVGLRIALFFLDFYTERGSIFYSSCRYDYLVIKVS